LRWHSTIVSSSQINQLLVGADPRLHAAPLQVLSEADLIAQLLLPLWATLPDAVRSPTLAYIQANWRMLKAEQQLVSRLSDTAFVRTGVCAAASRRG
jgi:hypothetical protein